MSEWDSKPGLDGMHRIALSKKVSRKIDSLRRPGESDNDVLRRTLDLKDAVASPGWRATAGVDMNERKIALSQHTMETAMQSLAPSKRPAVVNALVERFGLDRASLEDAAAFEFDSAAEAIPFIERMKGESAPAGFKLRAAAAAFVAKIAKAPVLQKLGESGWHKCAQALKALDAVVLCIPEETGFQLTDHDLKASHSIVVQHDWAQAFDKADQFDGGEYRLPYKVQVFEFRISGARVCFSVDTEDAGTPITSGLWIETPAGWALAALCTFNDGRFVPGQFSTAAKTIVDLCGKQVRAIAIALEAKVAVKELVRAPHKLNVARAKRGKLPLLDYHVVNLARRVRALPDAEPLASDHQGTKRRLHFRRGHWRHFENGKKTWIDWMLVGDPDLGFIDKHYTL